MMLKPGKLPSSRRTENLDGREIILEFMKVSIILVLKEGAVSAKQRGAFKRGKM